MKPTPAPSSDPLSGGTPVQDPLSLSPANDPLSAALLDPLSHAASETRGKSFVEKTEVSANREIRGDLH